MLLQSGTELRSLIDRPVVGAETDQVGESYGVGCGVSLASVASAGSLDDLISRWRIYDRQRLTWRTRRYPRVHELLKRWYTHAEVPNTVRQTTVVFPGYCRR